MNKKNNVPDKFYCTYWWDINLDPKNPQNKVSRITGYSKFQGQAEATDKISCLCRKIEMLEKNGYLDRSINIEIYKKLTTLPSKQNDRLLITLYPNDCEIPQNLVLKIPQELKIFLENFYKARKGLEIKQIHIIPRDKSFSKDDNYNLSKHFFRSLNDLRVWCDKQINAGENYNQVLKFYTNYANKHLLK